MLGGQFPPMPTPAEVLRRAAALQGSAADNVKDQHVVSQVLLRRFEETDPKDNVKKIYSFDLEYPGSSRARPTVQCGRAPQFDFVPFASRSVELKWKTVEDHHLPETLDAVANGTALGDPVHVQRLRDLIVLHFMRSTQSDIIRWRTWEPMVAAARQASVTLAGGQQTTLSGLAAQTVQLIESGAYFRVMIEDRFDRMCAWVQNADVEIITPVQGEFLIGDIPALLMLPGYIGTGALDEVGLLAAESIVLPLGPQYLAKLGGASQFTTIPVDEVNILNEAQVKAAFMRVFLRTSSGLNQFVRAVSRPKPSAGPLQDAYAHYKQ
jgi:fluoride ion exporter CrcB/FEX